MRQASQTVRCYQLVPIATDTAHGHAKVMRDMSFGNGPDEAITHVDRKHLNNRIRGDHGALEQLLLPKRGFRRLMAARSTLKGIETHRAVKKHHFTNNEPGLLN